VGLGFALLWDARVDSLETSLVVSSASLLALGIGFGLLARRSMRLGIDLTNSAVVVRQLFWDRVVRLDRIAALRVEECHDAESGRSEWHVARDTSERRLFTVPSGNPKLDAFVAAVRFACGGLGAARAAEQGDAADTGGRTGSA
jgi:hypothetical protein